MTLSTLDQFIIGTFVALILAIGWSTIRSRTGVLEFLTSGRSLSLPWFVATLVTTWYGGVLGIGESVSYYGVGTFLLLGVPYYAFGVLYALRMAKNVRAADAISIPERFSQTWSKNTGLIAGGLIFLLAVPAAHVLMLGLLVQQFLGGSLLVSTIIALAIGTAFLYRGGLLADVRVGMVAFVMMYVGFGAMVWICAQRYGALPLAATTSEAPNWTGGQGPLAILSFFILGAWTLVDPGFHQRVACAASPQVGQRGVLVSVGFWLLFDLLTVSTGLYALRALPSVPENPLLIFPALAERALPSGIKAIFLCGLLGTIVSAMVGYSLVAGASLGREIVARVKPMEEAKIKGAVQGGIAVSSVLALILAMSFQSVVALWYSWAGAVVGALLIPTLAAYRASNLVSSPWRSQTVNLAILASFAVSFAWMLYGLRTNNPFLTVTLAGQEFSLGTLVPGLLVSMIVLGYESISMRNRRER